MYKNNIIFMIFYFMRSTHNIYNLFYVEYVVRVLLTGN